MSEIPLFLWGLFVFFLAALWLRTALALRCLNQQGTGVQHKDLSVIIPLKGWDEGLPELLRELPKSYTQGEVELILIIDDSHPRRPLLDDIPQLRRVPLEAPPTGSRDKNARLLTGLSHAHFQTIVFIDSDVRVAPGFLDRRVQSHAGALSFSLPLYAEPSNVAEAFLAAFTAHSNMTIFASVFGVMTMPTAIGPCMVFTKRDTLREALLHGTHEIADDHATGHYFYSVGEHIHCAREPVVVTKPGAAWSESVGQIMRWMMLPRSVKHILHPRALLSVAFNSTLNAIPVSLLIVAAACASTGSPLWRPILIAAVVYLLNEGVSTLFLQQYALRERGAPLPLLHLVFVPLNLMLQLPLFLLSSFRTQVRWRGETVPITMKGPVDRP